MRIMRIKVLKIFLKPENLFLSSNWVIVSPINGFIIFFYRKQWSQSADSFFDLLLRCAGDISVSADRLWEIQMSNTQVEDPDGSKYAHTEEGGVVRSKIHCLETSKNTRMSEHELTKVCRTHKSLDMNARKSEHERTKIWWTHKSLNMNARESEQERPKIWTWTHESLDMNERKSGHEWTNVWTWTQESLIMNAKKFVRSCPD